MNQLLVIEKTCKDGAGVATSKTSTKFISIALNEWINTHITKNIVKEKEINGVDNRSKSSRELIVCSRRKRDGSGHLLVSLRGQWDFFSFSGRIVSKREELQSDRLIRKITIMWQIRGD